LIILGKTKFGGKTIPPENVMSGANVQQELGGFKYEFHE
jgi:hypothetical protein